jgi:hypothetical protein
MRIPSGSTDRYVFFVAVDSTDLKTRETGLSSFTVYVALDDGTVKQDLTPKVVEIDSTNMPGVYRYRIDKENTLETGHQVEELCIHITQASMAPVTRVVEISQFQGDLSMAEDLLTYYEGDYGYDIELTVYDPDGETVKDISSYTTSQEILFISPKGKHAVLKTAAFVTDGTDGKIDYQRASGDFDELGLWTMRAKVQTATEVYSGGKDTKFMMVKTPDT